MTARRGIFVAPFDELADPNTLAELAASAEAHGWDGFFVWDHVRYRAPVRAVADPWVALAAVAAATDRIRLGPLVTPLARRPGPEALAELAAAVSALRAEVGNDHAFDLIVDLPVDTDPAPWEAAGATWILTEFGVGAREKEVRDGIEAAPG